MLFIRADEVGRSWRIVDRLLTYWEQSDDPVPLYEAGTWGPREANALAAAAGRRWRHSGK